LGAGEGGGIYNSRGEEFLQTLLYIRRAHFHYDTGDHRLDTNMLCTTEIQGNV